MTPTRPIKPRELAFCWALVGKAKGVGTTAATMAGYKNPDKAANQLQKRACVVAWLDAYHTKREGVVIADADTRDRVLSEIMLDKGADEFARIGAAKELNKVTGRHSIRHIIEGKLTLEDAIAQSRRPEPEPAATASPEEPPQ